MQTWALACLILTQTIWALLYLTGLPEIMERTWAQFSAQAAYALACYLFGTAAAEYPSQSWMGRAFRALQWSCAAACLRHLIENPLPNLIWPNFTRGSLCGLFRQLLLLVIIGGLLYGVVAIYLTIHRLGLGFRPRLRDWLGVSLALILCIVIVMRRDQLSESTSAFVLAYWLQVINLVILLSAAAMSCLLQGMASQMGGCTLTNSFRFLAGHALLRAGLVALSLFPSITALPYFSPVHAFVFQMAPWLFALAATSRAQLSQIEKAQARHTTVPRRNLVEELITPL